MILDPSSRSIIQFPRQQVPLLVVVVDTETEFDWSGPFARTSRGVGSVGKQALAHKVFEKYGVRPTYVVDYPVSTDPAGFEPLKEWHEAGLCEIGAHLQPWENPPFDEELSEANSYAGNLPPDLERRKLSVLTDAIVKNFGLHPKIYKAGRYGIGPSTARTLIDLGYEIDVSVLPETDLRLSNGPDFSRCGAKPYWVDEERRLLEVPLTIGFAGLLATFGPRLHRAVSDPKFNGLHLPGILARMNLLERIKLTPEGLSFRDHRRLTDAMIETGHRVFSLTYHSPSLAPGNTPYVKNDADLRAFLYAIEQYLDYFMGKLGGRPATPIDVRDLARAI